MPKPLEQILKQKFLFSPGKNQLQDIERLIFEIMERENVPFKEILNYLHDNSEINKFSGRNRFFAIKDALIKRRFPLTSKQENIDTKKVFLPKVKPALENNQRVKKDFIPAKVFVEKKVKNSYLIDNIKNRFPDVKIEELDRYKDYVKKAGFTIGEFKKPLLFIIEENWDFIKPCPCTKEHLGCGYWILNLGFGCPFDCTYCFLQQYTNSPGILLPANLEDFFYRFDSFAKNLTRPIRIGTGEFCDSLALDEITQYSKKLIPYFKDKKVIFELKTKSDKIANLIEIEAPDNIVISWSLNPESIADKEEPGAASLKKRLKAAKAVQEKGYKLAFHFDPIIYSENWAQNYKEIIAELYSYLKAPFAWISLGTLRSNRELKVINELRFPESKIFYGELFLGKDKKLRYPEFLKKEIYCRMHGWIRDQDKETPLYLCMENIDMWRHINSSLDSTKKIEKYLLRPFL